MGVTLSSSLLYEGACERFNPPLKEMRYSPNIYMESIDLVSEIKQDLMNLKMDIYSLVESKEYESLNEAGKIREFGAKLDQFFMGIINALKKAKDWIIDKIMSGAKYILSLGKKKSSDSVVKTDSTDSRTRKIEYNLDDPDTVLILLDNNMFEMNGVYPDIRYDDLLYSESLAKFTDVDFDRLITSLNHINADIVNLSIETIRADMDSILNSYMNWMDNALSSFIGGGKVDTSAPFSQSVKKYYIGDIGDILADRDAVVGAYTRITKYGDAAKKLIKQKSDIERQYNELSKSIDRLRKESKNFADNAANVVNPNSVDAYAFKQIEDKLALIFNKVTNISNIITTVSSNHVTALAVKVECMTIANMQDNRIVTEAKRVVKKKIENGDINEGTVYLDREMYSIFEDALTEFCEQCALLKEYNLRQDFTHYVNEHVFLEVDMDTVKQSASSRIEKVVNLIVNMFKKFAMSVNQFLKLDQRWFSNHANMVKSADFKFPQQDENIEDWIPYNIDLINKKIAIAQFDENNNELMKNLENDETFAKHIFSIIGGNTNDAGNGDNASFAVRCRTLYEGGGQKQSIKVSELQKSKDKYYDYCVGYMQGENGGLYKSIVEDTKTLDKSKAYVNRVLKQREKQAEQAKKQQAQQAKQQQTTTTTQQQSTTNTNASIADQGKQQVTNNAATEEYGFSLAEALGIAENSLIHELTTPKSPDNGGSSNDNSTQTQTGTENDSLKELQDKATRYFTMMGNAIGARMSASLQCYKQYRSIFKWAVKEDNKSKNTETGENAQGNKEDDSIATKATAETK